MVKVSVIVPVYKAEKYFDICLDSLINQTFEDFEVICVNDGSPDNCINILRNYSKLDSRIKIFSQKNQGLSSARNTGLKYAKGEYYPLSFGCLERMNRAGFRTKAIIVKNIEGNEKAKGKTANLWRYRALKYGFNIFEHEYIMTFRKS